MFDIKIEDEKKVLYEEEGFFGEIIINSFRESFFLPTSYWTVEQYKESWKRAIDLGVLNNNPTVLAVSMRDPEFMNFIFTWVLYPENSRVFIQNTILFKEEIKDFQVENINSYIGTRETINEDGDKISEWEASKEDVLKFRDRL